jgi:hypothetical protein
MNVTLAEWLEIDRLARAASDAIAALDRRMVDLALNHFNDTEVRQFVHATEDRLSDAQYIAGALQLQSEWLGGDSSQANDGLREPNALSIVGRIPHLIPGSRNVARLK